MSAVLLVSIAPAGALVTSTLIVLMRPRDVSAHCDTMDGPAVKDGLLALETGNANIALKWVQPDGAEELGDIFARAVAVRGKGDDVRGVADQWFLENMIRIHRAGEGASYTGLQPAGAHVDERVRAADNAVASGDLAELAPLVPAEQLPELERRFAAVMKAKDFPVDDLDAGREFLHRYVRFFKLAEGHDHGDHHDHHHAEHSHV